VTQSAEHPLVAQAFDAKKHEELARAIENLTSEEAAFFLHKLENAIRKRKLQLTGYLVAMVTWLVTMVGALLYFGTHAGFVIWVFLIPFASVGALLYGFGRWAERIANAPPRARVATAADQPDAKPADQIAAKP